MPEESAKRAPPPPPVGGDRPLPSNANAEKAVLGCLLVDPAGAYDAAATQLLDLPGGAFFVPAHQVLFKTIVEVGKQRKEAVDLVTVANALGAAGLLDRVGGLDYLGALMRDVVTAANVEHYIGIVRDHALLRSLIRKCAEVSGLAFECQEPVKVLLDRVQGDIMDLADLQRGKEMTRAAELVNPAITYLDKLSSKDPSVKGLSSGFRELDKIIDGLRPDEMFVLAARPSIGKTALAMNIAANVAIPSPANPHPTGVAVFSLEMSSERLMLRLLCSEAKVSLGDIKDGAVSNARWTDITNAALRLKDAPLFIDDAGSMDILELRAKTRRVYQQHKIGLVVIDYLQLLRPSQTNRNSTRENEVSQMSAGIKGLAKELHIPIIVLAQLNRQAEQPGQKPRLSHLRESGAIEQDADIVALLHRERDTDTPQGSVREEREAELIVAKNRNGGTGIAYLSFQPEHTRFSDRAFVREEDVPQPQV